MKSLMIAVQSFVMFLATVASCGAGTAQFQHLNVGERSKLASPDGAWELVVSPAYPMSDSGTPVVVRRRGASKANVLLRVRRDAFVYWGANRLLIVDAPFADYTALHLFRLEPTGRVTPLAGKPDLDTSIRTGSRQRCAAPTRSSSTIRGSRRGPDGDCSSRSV